ncbi:MAG TPA: hypothetical protein VK175_11520 [Leadbetterella sp.]|jgi:hypothetical protein|nr:hypothetical protein [Leadbetterella sp.]
MKTQKSTSSVIWAVAIIVIGSLFLMRNFDMLWFELPKNLISWKLIFVFIAFGELVKGKVFSSIFWGIVATVFYYPAYLSQFSVNSVFELWPLLLIGVGLDMIIRRSRTIDTY